MRDLIGAMCEESAYVSDRTKGINTNLTERLALYGYENLEEYFTEKKSYLFEKWIPTCRYEGMYLHPGQKALDFAEEHGEDNFGCHNTDAHLRSSIIGRNVTVIIDDGVADLGEFGRIHFIDFDQTRGRTRTVQVMIIGE